MTLTQLFTAIANAIRAKTGSSETIVAEDFPDEIADITTGHLDNAEYEEANDDLDDILEGSTPVTIYPPDWSQIGYTNTPQSIIDGFNYAKTIKDSWNSSTTSLMEAYMGNKNVTIFPKIDIENVTNMNSTFYNAANLEIIPVLDTRSVTGLYSTFSGCAKLTTESLNNIMQMCINATSYNSTKTLKNLGLSSSQATTCQGLSNWSAFVAAGWSKGY